MRHIIFKRHFSGQSIVEYLLLITAVIAVLLIFLGRNGAFEKRLKNVYERQGNDMTSMVNKVFKVN